jgi:hypothetical protein
MIEIRTWRQTGQCTTAVVPEMTGTISALTAMSMNPNPRMKREETLRSVSELTKKKKGKRERERKKQKGRRLMRCAPIWTP